MGSRSEKKKKDLKSFAPWEVMTPTEILRTDEGSS